MILRLLLFFGLLYPVFVPAEDPAILDIRTQYNAIESLKMDSIVVNFELEDDPLAGKISIFRDGGVVKKIVLDSGSEHGGSTESFYYSDGQLFFVFQELSYWTFSGKKMSNGQSETVDTLTEQRFYYSGGRCIKALTRKTSSTDADSLGKLISKLPNLPLEEQVTSDEVGKKGIALFHLKDLF